MAYGTKYQIDWITPEGTEQVRLQQEGYSSSVTSLTPATEPIAIDWGEQGQQDLTLPFLVSTARIRFIGDANGEAVKEVFDSGDTEWRVQYRVNGNLEWQGYLATDLWQSNPDLPADTIELEAIDGLALLENENAYTQGTPTFSSVVGRILMGLHSLPIQTSMRWRPYNASVPAGDCPLNHLQVPSDAYQELENEEPVGPIDRRTQLEDVCERFGLQVFQAGGEWHLRQRSQITDGTSLTRYLMGVQSPQVYSFSSELVEDVTASLPTQLRRTEKPQQRVQRLRSLKSVHRYGDLGELVENSSFEDPFSTWQTYTESPGIVERITYDNSQLSTPSTQEDTYLAHLQAGTSTNIGGTAELSQNIPAIVHDVGPRGGLRLAWDWWAATKDDIKFRMALDGYTLAPARLTVSAETRPAESGTIPVQSVPGLTGTVRIPAGTKIGILNADPTSEAVTVEEPVYAGDTRIKASIPISISQGTDLRFWEWTSTDTHLKYENHFLYYQGNGSFTPTEITVPLTAADGTRLTGQPSIEIGCYIEDEIWIDHVSAQVLLGGEPVEQTTYICLDQQYGRNVALTHRVGDGPTATHPRRIHDPGTADLTTDWLDRNYGRGSEPLGKSLEQLLAESWMRQQRETLDRRTFEYARRGEALGPQFVYHLDGAAYTPTYLQFVSSTGGSGGIIELTEIKDAGTSGLQQAFSMESSSTGSSGGSGSSFVGSQTIEGAQTWDELTGKPIDVLLAPTAADTPAGTELLTGDHVEAALGGELTLDSITLASGSTSIKGAPFEINNGTDALFWIDASGVTHLGGAWKAYSDGSGTGSGSGGGGTVFQPGRSLTLQDQVLDVNLVAGTNVSLSTDANDNYVIDATGDVTSTQFDSHTSNPDAHHTRYTDAEARSAMAGQDVSFRTLFLDNEEFDHTFVGGAGGQLIYDKSTGLALHYGTSGTAAWSEGIGVLLDSKNLSTGSNLTLTGGEAADSGPSLSIDQGSGSDLDADTLDSYHASAFPRKTENATIDGEWTVDAAWSFGDEVFFSGLLAVTGSASFSTTPTVSGDVIWHEGNDGPGSGLNADTLDGYHGSDLAARSENETITGQWTWDLPLSSGEVLWHIDAHRSYSLKREANTPDSAASADLVFNSEVSGNGWSFAYNDTTVASFGGGSGVRFYTLPKVNGYGMWHKGNDAPLAHLADNETVTGNWSFDTAPNLSAFTVGGSATIDTANGFLRFKDGSGTVLARLDLNEGHWFTTGAFGAYNDGSGSLPGGGGGTVFSAGRSLTLQNDVLDVNLVGGDNVSVSTNGSNNYVIDATGDVTSSQFNSHTNDSDAHHSRYSDSEAVSAVEGATLEWLTFHNQEFDTDLTQRGQLVFDQSIGFAYYNDYSSAPGSDNIRVLMDAVATGTGPNVTITGGNAADSAPTISLVQGPGSGLNADTLDGTHLSDIGFGDIAATRYTDSEAVSAVQGADDLSLSWYRDTDRAKLFLGDYGSNSEWLTLQIEDDNDDRFRVRHKDTNNNITNIADFLDSGVKFFSTPNVNGDSVWHDGNGDAKAQAAVEKDNAVKRIGFNNEEDTGGSNRGDLAFDASVGLILHRGKVQGDSNSTTGDFVVLDRGNIQGGSNIEITGGEGSEGAPVTIKTTGTFQKRHHTSFTVGGSTGTFYPVLIGWSQGTYTGRTRFALYRNSVHTNGSWTGSFYAEISYWSRDYGNANTRWTIDYLTGSGDNPQPIGHIKDGKSSSSGGQAVVWLKGGMTYYLNSLVGEVHVDDDNSHGGDVTDDSGNTRSPTSTRHMRGDSFLLSDQDLGLGTNEPNAGIHVQNKDILIANDTNSGGSGVARLRFSEGSDSTADTSAMVAYDGDGENGPDNHLWLSANGNGQKTLVVTNGDLVGVGTASPNKQLHVAGDARVTGKLHLSGESNDWLTITNNEEFQYYAQGSEVFQVNNSGQIFARGTLYMGNNDIDSVSRLNVSSVDSNNNNNHIDWTQPVHFNGSGGNDESYNVKIAPGPTYSLYVAGRAAFEEYLRFDGGDHWITSHDGHGNFNFKCGVDPSNTIVSGSGGSHIQMQDGGSIHLKCYSGSEGNSASTANRLSVYNNRVETDGDLEVGGFFAAYQPSDIRLKDVEQRGTAATVDEWDVIEYTWNSKASDLQDKDQTHVGLIAQQVQKTLPGAVYGRHDGHLEVDPFEVTAVVVGEVQRLKAQVQGLKTQVRELKQRVEGEHA